MFWASFKKLRFLPSIVNWLLFTIDTNTWDWKVYVICNAVRCKLFFPITLFFFISNGNGNGYDRFFYVKKTEADFFLKVFKTW